MTRASLSANQPVEGLVQSERKATLARPGWCVLVLGWLLGFSQVCHAQTSLSEYQVKALFLFNFGKYVDWPAEAFSGPNTPITIAIVGASPCGQHLQKAVEGKTVSGRCILVRQVEKPEDLPPCQILFISDSAKSQVNEFLGKVKDRPVLTVGESEQFAQHGGVIGFVMREGKVRLEIDLKAARQAKLEISSKLLSVADTVTGKQ